MILALLMAVASFLWCLAQTPVSRFGRNASVVAQKFL